MKTISTVSEFKKFRDNLSGTLGFVPTMGALHGGHLSLINTSKKKCDHTVVSIFINPTQFSESEDLSTYPRTLDDDLKLLIKLDVDALFLPTKEIMYPEGYSTFIDENRISRGLENKSRPAFFKGVATIVVKLFNIVNPTHSFFGEKDAQQFRVIKKMVADLNFPIKIIPCPIIREKNGLAMSSRNKYLSRESKESAGIIYSALTHGVSLLNKGEQNVNIIRQAITQKIQMEPMAKIDYISISNNTSLEELKDRIGSSVLISVAVYFNGIRLIDNILYSSN